jgi:hypothetical protein
MSISIGNFFNFLRFTKAGNFLQKNYFHKISSISLLDYYIIIVYYTELIDVK